MSFQQDPEDLKQQRAKFFGHAVSGIAGFARRFFPADPRARKRDARRTTDIHLPSPMTKRQQTGRSQVGKR